MAEYALSDMSKPLGLSTYQLSHTLPANLQGQLPSIEALEKELGYSVMRQLVTGTSNSHQRVRPNQLSDIRVFAANGAAIGECSKLLAGLIERVMQNRQQSRLLSQLRDTLMPKLISGELLIPDAEDFLKERDS